MSTLTDEQLMAKGSQMRSHAREVIFNPDFYQSAYQQVMANPIYVPDIGTIRPYQYRLRAYPTADAVDILGALLGGWVTDDQSPWVLPDANDRAVVIRTQAQKKAVLDAWIERKTTISNRAYKWVEEANKLCDTIANITPPVDNDGNVITDQDAALAARNRTYTYLTETFLDRATITAYLTNEGNDTIYAVPTEISDAKDSFADLVNGAARDVRRWILDDVFGTAQAEPANSYQATSIQLLETRRQAGLRSVRNTQTIPATRTAGDAAVALVRGVGVEGGPEWHVGAFRVTNTAAYSGGSVNLTFSRPQSGRYTYTMTVRNPQVPGVAYGEAVLDPWKAPEDWTVAFTRGTLTIQWPKTNKPPSGVHTIDLTARNAMGPSRVKVNITVA